MNTATALRLLKISWTIINSSDLIFFFFTQEMKQKQYQLNSAKLHASVILYNTWFASKPSFFPFCFNRFFVGFENFKGCSRCKCKISTYCQRSNLQIYKRVCKIVKNYHNVNFFLSQICLRQNSYCKPSYFRERINCLFILKPTALCLCASIYEIRLIRENFMTLFLFMQKS